MIVDLPQFLSDLQKHKVENAKDCQQTKSQNVIKDAKLVLQAEKRTPFESSGGEEDNSWRRPEFKPPSSVPGDQAESEGIVKILEPGATQLPVHPINSSSAKPGSQSMCLSSNKSVLPHQQMREKVHRDVPSSNFQVATLADLFTRELSDANIQVGTD